MMAEPFGYEDLSSRDGDENIIFESLIYEKCDGTPWDANEHGLWCPNCGHHIAAPWNIDEDYEAPDRCRECGHE